LDDADDTLPARLTRYLEKQGFSRAALDHFVQLADPNALEPMTRNIANSKVSLIQFEFLLNLGIISLCRTKRGDFEELHFLLNVSVQKIVVLQHQMFL
jgi:hypothetical protein